MKDIDEIRRDNLRLLEREFGGLTAAADRAGMSPAQFANLRDGAKDSKTGKPRGMRKETARRIEESCGKPSGWLDAKHDSRIPDASISAPNSGVIVKSADDAAASMLNEPTASQGSKNTDGRASVSARPILAWDREEELGDEYVLIPRLDVKFSAGNGKIVWHVDEKGQKQAFRRAWCLRLGINPDHAATIVNEGQSMESRIQDGDSLVVDYKATRIIDGKVFALAYRDELYVKRLFKLPSGGLIVRSDNPDKARFPDINLSAEDMEFVEIIAQVKGVSGGV